MADYSTACWQKSTYSMANGNCVQAALLSDNRIAVRDSKHPDQGVLVFTASEWEAFVAGVKGCEFDFFSRDPS